MTWLRLALANLTLSPLTTAVNVLLMGLGTASIVLLLLASSQLRETMTRDAQNIDLVLGATGSPVQLILSAVYHADVPPGNIKLADTEQWAEDARIETAVPVSLGDSYRGFRIVGTTPDYLSLYNADLAQGSVWDTSMQAVLGAGVAASGALALGSEFAGAHGMVEGGHVHDSAQYRVVGVLEPTGTVIDRLVLTSLESVWELHSDEAHADHGHDEHTDDAHEEHDHEAHEEHADEEHDHEAHEEHAHDEHGHEAHEEHTHDEHDHGTHEDHAHDEHDHEAHEEHAHDEHESEAHEEHAHDEHDHEANEEHAHDEHDHDAHEEHAHDEHESEAHEEHEDEEHDHAAHEEHAHDEHDAETEITALLLTYRSPMAALSMPREINATGTLQAAAPAMEISRVLQLVGVGITALGAFAWVLVAVAGLSIFAALYGSLRSRRGELAMLRCLGATRGELLRYLIIEGLILTTLGVALGLLTGHVAMELVGNWLAATRGMDLTGWVWISEESLLLLGLLIVGILSAIVPAIQAYRTDVATTLVEA